MIISMWLFLLFKFFAIGLPPKVYNYILHNYKSLNQYRADGIFLYSIKCKKNNNNKNKTVEYVTLLSTACIVWPTGQML